GPILSIREDTEGTLLNLRLDATAPEGARLAAIGVDQHCSPSLLRRRATRLHKGTQDACTFLIKGRSQFCKKFTHDSWYGSPCNAKSRPPSKRLPRFLASSYRRGDSLQASAEPLALTGAEPEAIILQDNA